MNIIQLDQIKQEVLHSEPDVMVTAFPGQTSELVVAFTSKHPDRLDDPDIAFRQIKLLRGEGPRHILRIDDLEWNWLGRPGLSETLAQIIRTYVKQHGLTKVVAYGGSGGGTKALDMCGFYDFWGVFAIAPQIDLGPAFKAFDRRWSTYLEWARPGYNLPRPAHGFDSDAHIALFHGIRGHDAAHAALCPSRAGVYHYLYPDQEHSIGSRINPNQRFFHVFESFFAGDFERMDHFAIESGAIRRGVLEYDMPDPPWEEKPPPGEANRPGQL